MDTNGHEWEGVNGREFNVRSQTFAMIRVLSPSCSFVFIRG